MEYRTLGLTGLKVSMLSLVTMQFGWTTEESTARHILSAAHEAGVNSIDTADIYSPWVNGNPGGVAERIVGIWLKLNSILRDRVVLATKVRGNMGSGSEGKAHSRKHILESVENSAAIWYQSSHAPPEQNPISKRATGSCLTRWRNWPKGKERVFPS